MQFTTDEITNYALKLSQKSRASLAMILIDSLDNYQFLEDQNLNKWIKIAKRRDQEISNGEVYCRSHQDVIKRAYQKVQKIANS